jgi:hypothetical protein
MTLVTPEQLQAMVDEMGRAQHGSPVEAAIKCWLGSTPQGAK